MKCGLFVVFLLAAGMGASIEAVRAGDADGLQFIQPELQLGLLPYDQDFPFTFELTNRSDKAVLIANVGTSCHCTSVQKSPEVIAAHGGAALEINFNTSRADGPVTQDVVVETADGQIITGEFHAWVALSAAPASNNLAAPWIPDRGDGTYQNPVIFADYPDPDAVRVDDDYYLVSSSFNVAPGLPVLYSRDLVNWTIINHVFTGQPPAGPFSPPRHGEGVWGPVIRFHDGKFWVFYPDSDYGIYFSTADNPAGDWTPPQLILPGKGLIDLCPFWDDDGRLYLVTAWAGSRAGIANPLTLHELSADASKVLDVGRVIFDGAKLPNGNTLEGPKLYKRHGYYYVFASLGGVTGGYQAVFRATNIFGPYEHRIVLDQGGTAVNGHHQGAWVDTPSGEDWFLHSQDRGAYGRVVHLEPMIWRDDDWPVIGDDPQHNGKGQPVLVHAKPRVGRPSPVTTPQTSDEFAGPVLGLQWQWNANPKAGWALFSARPGRLRLASVPAPKTRNDGSPAVNNLYDAPNFLLQKFPAPEFTVTTRMEFAPATDGEFAGLAVCGCDYAMLGVRRTVGELHLVWVVSQGANRPGAVEREITGPDVPNSPVYLRVNVTSGATCRFAWSFDNQGYTAIGGPFQASGDHWIGAKVGLIASAEPSAIQTGHADFGWFHVTPLAP